MLRKTWITICTIITLVLLLGGCAQVQPPTLVKNNTEQNFVSNFTFSGTKHQVKITNKPQKLIVCGSNACDTLLALGVKDEIKVLTVENIAKVEQYKKVLPNASIYPYVLSQEAALTLKPDFIVGQRRYFDDKLLGDTVFWEQNGTMAYIQDASGPIPSLGNFPKCTVESEKQFISNMGKVLQKQNLAEQYVGEIDNALKSAQANVGKQKPKVLVVEFLGETIEVFGKNLLSGDVVTKLGAEIIDYGYPFVSLEKLVEIDPDIIFVVYHGGNVEEKAALSKLQGDIFKQFTAVKKQRVYPLPYNLIVATGVHTKETIELFSNAIAKRE